MLRTGLILGAVAVKSRDVDTDVKKNPLFCRPSELPIYSPARPPKPKRSEHQIQDSALHQSLEQGIRVVRTEIQSGYQKVIRNTEVLTDYYDVAKAHTQNTIDYLNEPQNTLPRSGAIAIGGLAGFIFAARGGFIKKLIYTTLGTGSVASLCYPREAEEKAKLALYGGRKVFAVAYNFIKGIKPGDEVPVDPFNGFPTSLEELKTIVLDLYDEAKTALFSKKE